MVDTANEIEMQLRDHYAPQTPADQAYTFDRVESSLSVEDVSNFRISFIQKRESITSQGGEFHTLLHILQIMLTQLQGGTMTMNDVLGITRPPNFNEFKQFLQLIEIYGCGYLDDVDYSKYQVRQKTSHFQSMAHQLDKLIMLYDMIIFVLNQDKDQQPRVKGTQTSYSQEFMKFVTFQRQQWLKIRDLQVNKPERLQDDVNVNDQGHLVQFSCGHRGQPSRIEEKRVSRLMRASGFIPMLEDIPVQKDKQQSPKVPSQLMDNESERVHKAVKQNEGQLLLEVRESKKSGPKANRNQGDEGKHSSGDDDKVDPLNIYAS